MGKIRFEGNSGACVTARAEPEAAKAFVSYLMSAPARLRTSPLRHS